VEERFARVMGWPPQIALVRSPMDQGLGAVVLLMGEKKKLNYTILLYIKRASRVWILMIPTLEFPRACCEALLFEFLDIFPALDFDV
jgi:hypothetical protein